jgi:hypothetical protein
MNKEFLNRVIKQVVSETIIDYNGGKLYAFFYLLPIAIPLSQPHITFSTPYSFFSSFNGHCKEVYGLSDNEIEYIWIQYRNSLVNKLTEAYN